MTIKSDWRQRVLIMKGQTAVCMRACVCVSVQASSHNGILKAVVEQKREEQLMDGSSH